jgi:hypothetical protein
MNLFPHNSHYLFLIKNTLCIEFVLPNTIIIYTSDMTNDKSCLAHEIYMTHEDDAVVSQHFLRMKTFTQT